MYSHINVQKHTYNHMYMCVKKYVYVYKDPDGNMGADSFLFIYIHLFVKYQIVTVFTAGKRSGIAAMIMSMILSKHKRKCFS